jgi:hypothetical protein
MPWRQLDVMTERFQFIRDARQRLVTFTELCAMYGISRFRGCKWLHRAEQSGLDIPVRTRPPPRSRRGSSRHGGIIRRGGRASCSPYCAARIGATATRTPGPPEHGRLFRQRSTRTVPRAA